MFVDRNINIMNNFLVVVVSDEVDHYNQNPKRRFHEA